MKRLLLFIIITLCMSFQASAWNIMAIKIDAGAWSIQTSDAWSTVGNLTSFSIGIDQISKTGGADGWKIDDVQLREGYEAS